jgi:hypothetical protein
MEFLDGKGQKNDGNGLKKIGLKIKLKINHFTRRKSAKIQVKKTSTKL